MSNNELELFTPAHQYVVLDEHGQVAEFVAAPTTRAAVQAARGLGLSGPAVVYELAGWHDPARNDGEEDREFIREPNDAGLFLPCEAVLKLAEEENGPGITLNFDPDGTFSVEVGPYAVSGTLPDNLRMAMRPDEPQAEEAKG